MIRGTLRRALASILFLKSLKWDEDSLQKIQHYILHALGTLIYLDKYKVYGNIFQIRI